MVNWSTKSLVAIEHHWLYLLYCISFSSYHSSSVSIDYLIIYLVLWPSSYVFVFIHIIILDYIPLLVSRYFCSTCVTFQLHFSQFQL